MAVTSEVIEQRFDNIVVDAAIDVNIKLFAASDVRVFYGDDRTLAVQGTDYLVVLTPDDYDTFSITPLAPLLTKIGAGTNVIYVRRSTVLTSDFSSTDAFLRPKIQTEFDRTLMRIQEVLPPVSDRPGSIFAFDDNGLPVAGPSKSAFEEDVAAAAASATSAGSSAAAAAASESAAAASESNAATSASNASTSAAEAAASAATFDLTTRSVGELSDVDTTGVGVNETLIWNGTSFVKGSVAGVAVFDEPGDIAAVSIPTSVDLLQIPGVNAVADFLPAAPSPVKPWHVLSDNGRYFELRFPDGRVNVRAFGAVGDDVANDTQAFKDAFEYINRAWWETSGGAAQGKFQRGCVFVPPGVFRIDPTNPVIAYDFLKLRGVGDGQSIVKAHNTSAGALVERPSTASYNSNQRTTHVEIEGLRFILTGTNQTALDLAHVGRGRVTRNLCGRNDRVGDWNNSNQSVLSGTRFLRLRNSDTVMVGGDIFEVDHNHVYYVDRAVDSGNGASAPGPEALRIHHNEFSDCSNPIVVNEYGGAGGAIVDNVIQRWAVGSRAIDLVGRFWRIQGNYLEAEDNDRPPILIRTGSIGCIVHRLSHVNYTAHVQVEGPPVIKSLGTNDGTDCRDETNGALAAAFAGWAEY